MWVGRINNFIDEGHMDSFFSRVVDIAGHDETFPYYFKSGIDVFFKSGDKNNLYKRMVWLVKNLDERKTAVFDVYWEDDGA